MRVRDKNKELAIRRKALKMIVKKGFDGFSMQKLAKEARLAPGTLYIYFKSKDDLILQLCEVEGKKMADAMLKDFDPSMSFREGMKIQWMNRANYCLKHPEEMYFLELIKHTPIKEKSAKVMDDHFKKVMTEFAKNAIQKKELLPVPLEVYWSVAFAPLYNLVKFHKTGTSIGGYKFSFSDEVMLKTLELVLKALKP
jgi:TetR/AcrR family transcriptional repressor of multidrug resistance operon